MPERLVIIGAATPTIIRVVDDINRAGGRQIEVVGFLDNAFANRQGSFHGFPILGGFEAVVQFPQQEILLINTIAGSVDTRVDTTEHFLSGGYRFTNIIHPGVNLGYVTLGTGNLVYENAVIQPFVSIGDHCVVSTNSGIAHDTMIGEYCFVGPAAYVCGKVEIADKVFVGTGAHILPRLKIGARSTVAAGALVTADVAAGTRVMGVPAKEG